MRHGAIALATALLIVSTFGCSSSTSSSASSARANVPGDPLQEARESAARSNRPIVLLIYDARRSREDANAASTFSSAVASKAVIPISLDLGISRNRAVAALFHAADAPTLICLSPGGVIVSRDAEELSAALLTRRVSEAIAASPTLDAEYERLRSATRDNATHMRLAQFLLAHLNDREAISELRIVYESESEDVALRVYACVEMSKAHLWIGEPEKARHAAQRLLATLGPASAEAMAGGNLIMGLQDVSAKRLDLSRKELHDAIAAAPDSTYAKEARVALEHLPTTSGSR